MERTEILEQKVRNLYLDKNAGRAEWADWLYENHVFTVANYAVNLSKRLDVDPDLPRASAMLHDIADAVLGRFDDNHAEKSAEIARSFLIESGYDEDEIGTIVDDALRYHSCREENLPKTIEGKILATADALAHLKTDFYLYYFVNRGLDERSFDEAKESVVRKINKDYHTKIQFDEIKHETIDDYNALIKVFTA